MDIFCNAYTVQLNEVASGNRGTGGGLAVFQQSLRRLHTALNPPFSREASQFPTLTPQEAPQEAHDGVTAVGGLKTASPVMRIFHLCKRANFKWVKALALLEQPLKRKVWERISHPGSLMACFPARECIPSRNVLTPQAWPRICSAPLCCSTHSPTPQSLGIKRRGQK